MLYHKVTLVSYVLEAINNVHLCTHTINQNVSENNKYQEMKI